MSDILEDVEAINQTVSFSRKTSVMTSNAVSMIATEREALIVKLSFGLDEFNHCQCGTGRGLGFDVERVRQIRRTA